MALICNKEGCLVIKAAFLKNNKAISSCVSGSGRTG
jgi:hypothetical protein